MHVRTRHYMRPVHPECRAHGRTLLDCNCAELWHGPVNDQLYVRHDYKTRWGRHLGSKGCGPDAEDSILSMTGIPDHVQFNAYEEGDETIVSDSFWKESEFRSQFPDLPTDCKKVEKST